MHPLLPDLLTDTKYEIFHLLENTLSCPLKITTKGGI